MARQTSLPDAGIFRADLKDELQKTLAATREYLDRLYVLESHLEDAMRDE